MNIAKDNSDSINFANLSTEELYQILEGFFDSEEKKANLSTEVAFEILQRVIGSHDSQLYYGFHFIRLLQMMTVLSSKEKFCKLHWRKLIDSIKMNVPMPILYHMNKSSLYLYHFYIANKDVQTLVNELDSFFKSSEYYFFICDLIIAIHQETDFQNTWEINDQHNYNWQEKCHYLSNNFIKNILINFEGNPKTRTMRDFLCFCKNVTIKNNNFHNIFNTMILSLITSDTDKISMIDAYIMQSLWTMEICPEIYDTMWQLINLSSIRNMNQFLSDIPFKKMNLKYALIFVAVYGAKMNDGHKGLQSFVNEQLTFSFGVSPNNERFNMTLLIARHACFSKIPGFETYNNWYANTFGINTSFTTGSNSVHFIRLMFYLKNLVEVEPKNSLQVHIDRSLKVPRCCQSIMHEFKDLCRMQMAKINKNPTVQLDGSEFAVVCLLHHAKQSTELIFALRQPKYCKLLLPWLLGNYAKYKHIIILLKRNKIITFEDIVKSTKLCLSEETDEDFDEFFQ